MKFCWRTFQRRFTCEQKRHEDLVQPPKKRLRAEEPSSGVAPKPAVAATSAARPIAQRPEPIHTRNTSKKPLQVQPQREPPPSLKSIHSEELLISTEEQQQALLRDTAKLRGGQPPVLPDLLVLLATLAM